MDTAEVIPGHIERDRMFQVLQLPAVSVGQARKPPKLASQGQIAPLDVRSRDVAGIGPPVFDAWDGSDYPARGSVPFGASDIVTRKQFDELGIICTTRKMFLDSGNVPAQPIRR